VEGLRDVRTRELNNDLLLALGGVRRVLQTLVAIGTKSSLLLQNTAKHGLSEGLGLAEELQMRAGDAGGDEVGFGEFGGQFLAKLLRVLLDTERGNLTA